jgi:hypothetical protein
MSACFAAKFPFVGIAKVGGSASEALSIVAELDGGLAGLDGTSEFAHYFYVKKEIWNNWYKLQVQANEY